MASEFNIKRKQAIETDFSTKTVIKTQLDDGTSKIPSDLKTETVVNSEQGSQARDGYLKYLIDHETGQQLDLQDEKREQRYKLSLLNKSGELLDLVYIPKELPNYLNLTYKQLCINGVGELVWEDQGSGGEVVPVKYVLLSDASGILSQDQYKTLLADRMNRIIIDNKILKLASTGGGQWGYTNIEAIKNSDGSISKYLYTVNFDKTRYYTYSVIDLDSTINEHIANVNVHLKQGEREKWNNKANIEAVYLKDDNYKMLVTKG